MVATCTMTRQAASSESRPSVAAKQRAMLLRPVAPPKSLSDEVCNRLAGGIASGQRPQGAKLPSETEMMAAMGVSRTVVREAVAALRARGLVMTRQGVGAFVNPDPSRRLY